MQTLTILGIYFIIASWAAIVLFIDGYKKQSKILFWDLTCAPLSCILLLICVIGLAPN